jgi:hypothetical protein
MDEAVWQLYDTTENMRPNLYLINLLYQTSIELQLA